MKRKQKKKVKFKATDYLSKNNVKFNIICFDPSLTAFGYSVLNGNNILEAGCIKTKPVDKKLRIRKGDDKIRRLIEINQVLKRVIKDHKIAYIISELPHGSQSAPAAIALGMITGIIQAMADFLDIGIEWYSEGDAKKALFGRLSASKQETIDKIDKLYKVNWFNTQYKDEAIADSLAIHYVALQQSSTLKLMNR